MPGNDDDRRSEVVHFRRKGGEENIDKGKQTGSRKQQQKEHIDDIEGAEAQFSFLFRVFHGPSPHSPSS